MITTLESPTSLDDLAIDLDGILVRPGDPEWDTARSAWQLSVDQHPADPLPQRVQHHGTAAAFPAAAAVPPAVRCSRHPGDNIKQN